MKRIIMVAIVFFNNFFYRWGGRRGSVEIEAFIVRMH